MKGKIDLLIPPIFKKIDIVPLYLKGKILYNNVSFKKELLKQISELPELEKMFPVEKIKKHYVYHKVRDTEEHPDIHRTRLRFYWYYRFFKKNYPDIFNRDTTVLDIGSTSGLFLDLIGKKGTVLNIDEKCIDFINKKGIKTIKGNAESTGLKDNSFDYVCSFQCVEHLPNPIKALNEMGRIARKKVFISIPYKEKTRIYSLDYWKKAKKENWDIKGKINIGDGHIFEFSTDDFKKILSYTNLEYKKNEPIYFFDNKTKYRRYYNSFRKSYFNFFVLNPKK